MPMSEMPSWLTNALSALGGAGAGGYALFRMYKRDKNSDTIDTKSQRLIDNLCAQLDSERESHSSQLRYERETNAILGQKIDALAKERNEAVQNVGKLEGQVTALQQQVTHLRTEVEKLERGNAALIEQVTAMREELAKVSCQLVANK